MDKIDIRSLTSEKLAEVLPKYDIKGFRAGQIFRWIHYKGVYSFDEMTNVSLKNREVLKNNFELAGLVIDNKQVSEVDGTVKYLFMLDDESFIETVVMPYKHGNSICISTQVGCKMGCTFCASTKAGFVRNLTAGEMLAQIYTAAKDMGEKISSVVLMGIGEPLDNYDNVIDFINILRDENGINMSPRHVTISTCGVVPNIDRLREERLGITLSVSLHSPFDKQRSEMMPINDTYNIDLLLRTLRDYTRYTSRRLSIEYIMLDGVNDSRKHMEKLADLLKGLLCHVNLISANEVSEFEGRSSGKKQINICKDYLLSRGINVTIRRKMGTDIEAACGQLRRERQHK